MGGETAVVEKGDCGKCEGEREEKEIEVKEEKVKEENGKEEKVMEKGCEAEVGKMGEGCITSK